MRRTRFFFLLVVSIFILIQGKSTEYNKPESEVFSGSNASLAIEDTSSLQPKDLISGERRVLSDVSKPGDGRNNVRRLVSVNQKRERCLDCSSKTRDDKSKYNERRNSQRNVHNRSRLRHSVGRQDERQEYNTRRQQQRQITERRLVQPFRSDRIHVSTTRKESSFVNRSMEENTRGISTSRGQQSGPNTREARDSNTCKQRYDNTRRSTRDSTRGKFRTQRNEETPRTVKNISCVTPSADKRYRQVVKDRLTYTELNLNGRHSKVELISYRKDYEHNGFTRQVRTEDRQRLTINNRDIVSRYNLRDTETTTRMTAHIRGAKIGNRRKIDNRNNNDNRQAIITKQTEMAIRNQIRLSRHEIRSRQETDIHRRSQQNNNMPTGRSRRGRDSKLRDVRAIQGDKVLPNFRKSTRSGKDQDNMISDAQNIRHIPVKTEKENTFQKNRRLNEDLSETKGRGVVTPKAERTSNTRREQIHRKDSNTVDSRRNDDIQSRRQRQIDITGKRRDLEVRINNKIREVGSSTANIKALKGSLGALSVNKLSHIPKLQPISAVYENQ